MRVVIGKALRVGPGDQVVIRGRLPELTKLGRIFVFAKTGDADYSPYVENLSSMLSVVGERPQLYTPMSLRLNVNKPQGDISFVSDIDGWVQVMQELDRKEDSRVVVKLSRTINPELPWRQRLWRTMTEWLPWKR